VALEPGKNAPGIRLPDARGGGERRADFDRLTLLAFVKHNCPVCQMAAPYIEKFTGYAGPAFEVLAIAQDPAEPAAAFARHYGLSAPLALDEAPYRVSNAYRLTNVPTLFLVEPGGRIAETLVNWNRQGYNDFSEEVARRLGREPVTVVEPGDPVQDYRPG